MQDILNNLSQNDVIRILDEWNVGAGEEGFLSVAVFVDSENADKAHRIFLENQETEAKAMLALIQSEDDLDAPLETFLQWVEDWQNSRNVIVLDNEEEEWEEGDDEEGDDEEEEMYY